MSVHVALGTEHPLEAICGGNAAMLTRNPDKVSCHACLNLLRLRALAKSRSRYPQPPSEGSRACMIYKHTRRLEDACDGCSLSATYCAANTDINGQRCCGRCSHQP